jgi:hypothetical protein
MPRKTVESRVLQRHMLTSRIMSMLELKSQVDPEIARAESPCRLKWETTLTHLAPRLNRRNRRAHRNQGLCGGLPNRVALQMERRHLAGTHPAARTAAREFGVARFCNPPSTILTDNRTLGK